jgi:hypothetical protein
VRHRGARSLHCPAKPFFRILLAVPAQWQTLPEVSLEKNVSTPQQTEKEDARLSQENEYVSGEEGAQ